MNNFPFAYEPVKHSEGGYVNDAADPGGETYAGISRVAWPSWSGWKALDLIPGKARNHKFSSLDNQVTEFYYTNFWMKNHLDQVVDQNIAAAALDTVVNHGRGPYLIQQALQKLGQPVTVDGRIGPDTLHFLNSTLPKNFLSALYDVRRDYYNGLVDANPALAKFLPGWLSRIGKWQGVATVAAGGFIGLTVLGIAALLLLRKAKVI